MKHKIRDSIIFLIDIFGISALYCWRLRKKGPLVRVLAFHDVADKVWFEQVISMLVKNYHILTPEQLHNKDFNREKINILLTFDDGYQSWIDNCLPVLQKFNLKGLFFINSGLLDIAHDEVKVAEYMKNRLLISPKKPLSWDGARKLLAEGHNIGGHTVHHPNLALLSPIELEKEIREDKKKIEDMLQTEPVDFAYPFGRKDNWNTVVLDMVHTCGYAFVYDAESGFVDTQNYSQIARVCLEKGQSVASVQRWIRGGYDILHFLQ